MRLNDDEVYRREYERAAIAARQAYERSSRELAVMLVSACLFERAFLSDKDLSYFGDPDAARQDCDVQSEAARAVHRIWRQYNVDDAALTGNERALGRYLEREVARAVETEAELAALDGMAANDEPARLRAIGAC